MAMVEAQLIADVEAGPAGPKVAAFFDFDGTLIDGYSLRAFARHHLRSAQVAPGRARGGCCSPACAG